MHKNQDSANQVASKNYDPSDYKKKDQLSSGLAITHEQVSDTFTEGNSDAVIDDLEGEDVKIARKGFQQ